MKSPAIVAAALFAFAIPANVNAIQPSMTASALQQSHDPTFPNCNECIYHPDYQTWVCPTPQHYAICPFI